MSLEKSAAIILRVVDFSNTSCVVTMYTRDFGKITALAKGARRSKSPFEAALDVLSICHVVFVHKSTDALDILTEAKLERRFRAAARDLNQLYLAYYFVELTTALTEHVDPQPELFDLLEAAIIGLDQGESNEHWMLRFEMRLLSIIGHGPALDFCVSCGRKVEGESQVWFSIAASGLMCGKCRPGNRNVVQVSEKAIETLKRFSDLGDAWRLPIDESVAGQVRGIVNQLIMHLLGYRPKLVPYLGPSKST
jgi:DNA repair protein RecO (recombination protein O)